MPRRLRKGTSRREIGTALNKGIRATVDAKKALLKIKKEYKKEDYITQCTSIAKIALSRKGGVPGQT